MGAITSQPPPPWSASIHFGGAGGQHTRGTISVCTIVGRGTSSKARERYSCGGALLVLEVMGEGSEGKRQSVPSSRAARQ